MPISHHCEGCDADLTHKAYSLVLRAQGWRSQYDSVVYPPPSGACHFCDLNCLDYWRAREHYYIKLLNEWSAKKDAAKVLGRTWGSDIIELRKREFRSAALEKYPLRKKEAHDK